MAWGVRWGCSVAADSKSVLLNKSMHGLYIGALMFLTVIMMGSTAYYLEGWKIGDAFYMVIITVFSVGYEEVEPVATPMLRAITMCIIVAGDASKVYFVGSLVQFITEGEIGRAMEEHRKSRSIDTITDHAIICGYGRIGQVLARELEAKKFPFLILDNNAERVALAHTHGYQGAAGRCGRGRHTLRGAHRAGRGIRDRAAERHGERLHHADGAKHAAYAADHCPRGRSGTEKKLKQAGANEIILPAFVGGMQIANSITEATLDSILKGGATHLNSDLKNSVSRFLSNRSWPTVCTTAKRSAALARRGVALHGAGGSKAGQFADPASGCQPAPRGGGCRGVAVTWRLISPCSGKELPNHRMSCGIRTLHRPVKKNMTENPHSGCPRKKRLVTTRRVRAMSCPNYFISENREGWRG